MYVRVLRTKQKVTTTHGQRDNKVQGITPEI